MANLDQLMEDLSKLTVVEAADLVKKLEEKWGVKAASGGGGMMMAAPVAAAAAPAAEKTEFTVVLADAGAEKIKVIKEVRAITGLGLKEAKELVEAGGKAVKEKVGKEEAEKIKEQLVKAGATVELK